ncbi:MAG: esterase, partial [Clostridia bacterium]|nr:esterase [Clostridia bacterium]
MQEWYDRQYSPILNRDMEHALIGHDGKLCLAFAPQNGHTWDFRNFGMVETVRPWIDAGRLKILLVDSIDEETWSNEHGDGRYRIELQERWFHYIMEELLPQYLP